MNCKKCGKKLKIGENYCTVCGYYNKAEDETLDEDIKETSSDDDLFDEIEEIDEEDFNKDNNNDEVVEENLINKFNIPDENEINE